MSDTIYTAQFASTFEAMDGVLNAAIRAMSAHGCLGEGQEPCARLCLEEALVNAVKHGNKLDRELMVDLEIAMEDDSCVIRVRDEGGGFCPDQIKLPDPETPGGRGVCLMRHFMDSVRFDSVRKCLEMHFHKQSA